MGPPTQLREEKRLLLWAQIAKQRQTLCFRLRGREVRGDDRPGMAAEGEGQAFQPIHGQVALAKLQVADLLARRADQRSQSHQGEASRLPKLFEAISHQRAGRDSANQCQRRFVFATGKMGVNTAVFAAISAV